MQTLMNMHKSMAGSFNKKNQIDSNASATYDLTGTYLGNEKEIHGKIIVFSFSQFCKIYIMLNDFKYQSKTISYFIRLWRNDDNW